MSFRYLFFTSALLFTGCASSEDVSGHGRFRSYVGRTVPLNRPMLLVKHSGYIFGGANDVVSRRNVSHGLTEPGTYRAPKVFAKLPTGHRVIIDAIHEEVCGAAYHTVIYGRTTFPQTAKRIRFACVRAPLSYLHSESLPWEY